MRKIPHITLMFWILKIFATTIGETAGDLLSMTLKVGYAVSSLILISFFLVTVIAQLSVKRYHPALYWLVILSTSTAGTTMSDYMDRTLELGYLKGTLILITILVSVLVIWYLWLGTLSVNDIASFKAEFLYWTAILFSNTLGTALGDFLADDSGLGFGGGVLLISSLIAVTILLYYLTKVPHVLLFWIAFVLTRPFGATMGDLLTKDTEKGGMELGPAAASGILAIPLLIFLTVEIVLVYRKRAAGMSEEELAVTPGWDEQNDALSAGGASESGPGSADPTPE